MGKTEFNGGFQIAELAAAVVTLALEWMGDHMLILKQIVDAIGELDLATGALAGLFKFIEDARGEQIATDHRQIGWRICRCRFFDDRDHAQLAIASFFDFHDTYCERFVRRFQGLLSYLKIIQALSNRSVFRRFAKYLNVIE